MDRFIEISLTKRRVSCVARLLTDEAPRTCEAIWPVLPLEGDAYHAKYARNELYTFVDPFADADLGLENPTITPIPGDVCSFNFAAAQLPSRSYGYGEEEGAAGRARVVDIAIFYGRNNLLLNADIGFVPATVFGTIVDGLSEMAAACNDVWRAGAVGERLAFRRVD